MKRILLIATGGTISCRDTGCGLAPALSGEELLAFLPEAAAFCSVAVCNLFALDSTDMTTANRVEIARCIRENYARYDGFVVTHGTDSLAYTAALLSHMCRNLDKPVIVTGSQKPIGVPESDAERNLLDALRVAASGCTGIAVVMYGKIICGRHIVKMHSSDPTGFESVNAPQLGSVAADGTVRLDALPTVSGVPTFVEPQEHRIMVLKLVPDMDSSIFGFLEKYDRVILEAYGAGGIPVDLEAAVHRLIGRGTRVYITTQCPMGGADLSVYEVGRRAEKMGAICLGQRTVADAVAAILCEEI